MPDPTSRNSGTLENDHCRTRPSSLKLAKDYSASGASNGLMVGAKRKGPAAPMRCGAHCDTRSRNIKPSRTGIAEAAERLNPGQKCEGATGSLAIVAPDHDPAHPRSLHHGSRLPAMSRRGPQVRIATVDWVGARGTLLLLFAGARATSLLAAGVVSQSLMCGGLYSDRTQHTSDYAMSPTYV